MNDEVSKTPVPGKSALPANTTGPRPHMTPARKSFWSAFILHPSSFILSPLAAAVVGLHLLIFWWVSDKYFLPKAPAYLPPPTPPNFAGAVRRAVDPHTGETVTETLFVVSTKLATPVPHASPVVK